MGDVISINQPKSGDSTFVMCGCIPEGTPFVVVAIVGQAPLISCLVCPECNKELEVNNGFINIDPIYRGD